MMILFIIPKDKKSKYPSFVNMDRRQECYSVSYMNFVNVASDIATVQIGYYRK